jgi:methionine-rich copper-binding protein CopC
LTIRPVRAITSSAAAVAAALLLCATVFAHGGETFFLAEPALVQPGGGVGVRADLPTSGPVRLSLAGTDGTRREVGVVEQTDDGHFEVFIQIPMDLPTGHWMLLAEAESRAIASTTIDVVGTPIGEETGGQGPRDEDDQLLVALPSGWRASRVNAPEVTGPGIVSPTGEQPDPVPFVSLAVAVIALALLVARTRPRRSVEGPSKRVR